VHFNSFTMNCDGPVCENEDLKMRRCLLREKSIRKNRVAYDHSQTEWRLTVADQYHSKPHRAARAAKRTRLANGLMETSSDMPALSMGFTGKKSDCRKPSVSTLVKSQMTDLDVQLQEDIIDDFTCKQSQAPMGWTVSFSRTSSQKLWPLRRKHRSHSEAEADESIGIDCSKCNAFDDVCMDTTAGETTASDHSDSADDSTSADSPGKVQIAEQKDDGLASMPSADSSQGKADAKRKLIFRDLIVKLRDETREAQQAAVAAERKAQEAHSQVRSRDLQQRKLLLQAERQRSMEQRKKRNQANHLQALKEKSDKVLLQANAIKNNAEMEAAEIRTRAIADAQVAVTAFGHLAKREQEEELKAHQSMKEASDMKAQIESQAQATLIRAEMCAHEMKQQASLEAALHAEALVQSAKSLAEQEASSIKANALKHALALHAKVEEQAQVKLEAAEHAQATAEAAAAVAAATAEKIAADEREAEKQARLLACAAMKDAKVLEQQRAKKQQRQEAQQRHQVAHLQNIREKTEMTLQAANAVRSKTEMEVAEIRAQAVIDAQAVVSSQKQSLMDAHAEVQELRDEAVSMKAVADAQAQAALSEAAINAEEMKRTASTEAAIQAEAMIQAAKYRADQEALSIKATALEHALALRNKVEEQVQAKLGAAKHSQCQAETAAATVAAKLAADEKDRAEKNARAQAASALKRAKELEQQRAKKHQRQATQERRMQELKQRALDEAMLQASEETRKIKEQALQEVASLKAQARAEAQGIKSKAKATVRAKVHEHTQKLSAAAEAEALLLKARAEEEVQAIRRQLDVEQSNALAQMQREIVEAEVEEASVAEISLLETTAVMHDDVADTDWEVLPNMNIEECLDTTWDMV